VIYNSAPHLLIMVICFRAVRKILLNLSSKHLFQTQRDLLNLQLLPADDDAEDKYKWDDANFFKELELGGVAHELGTLPLKCYDAPDKNALVEPDLELALRKGVYVCDLSVFPYSPEVNPTPTLVALALRLSRERLHPRIPKMTLRFDAVYVMNQSGESIKVYISNLTGTDLSDDEVKDNKDGGKVLKPGELINRGRNVDQPIKPVAESVMVYTLQFDSLDKYLPKPVTYVATLGTICIID